MQERIIPARAGPTVPWRPRPWRGPDHPRSCGANHAVRGKHRLPRRIIPARAGPTRATWTKPVLRADHPRSCGANVLQMWEIHIVSGSSPLVRGQLCVCVYVPYSHRIIPARAGPTESPRHLHRHGPDHPRSCGANAMPLRLFTPTPGSSPLVRGQLSGPNRGLQFLRIIPARAGPTQWSA